MSDYLSHLSVTIWSALVVLVLGAIVDLPTRVLTTELLGSPVSLTLSGHLIVGLVAVAIVCAGLEAGVRTLAASSHLTQTWRFWGLPSAIVMAAAIILPATPNQTIWFILLVVTGVSLGATLIAEIHTVDAKDPRRRAARLTLNLFSYLLAASAFVLIYISRSRSLISATSIGLLAFLLSLELLRDAHASNRQILLVSGVIGIIMAQSTWVLNYWPYASIRMGLILLVIFYLLVGLTRQGLSHQLSSQRALEYIALATIVTALIVWLPQ